MIGRKIFGELKSICNLIKIFDVPLFKHQSMDIYSHSWNYACLIQQKIQTLQHRGPSYSKLVGQKYNYVDQLYNNLCAMFVIELHWYG